MAEHMPWVGSLSVDLRKGALSVSADGLTVIDEDGVCWGIVFPDKRGHYDHATAFVEAVNNHEAMDKLLAEAADFLNVSPTMDGMDIGAKITQFRLGMQKAGTVPVGGAS